MFMSISNKNKLTCDPMIVSHNELKTPFEEQIPQDIKNHFFNTKIIIELPDTTSILPEILEPVTEDTNYYEVKDLKLEHLCDKEFINYFVKNGHVFGYSCSSFLDQDNSAALTPSGELCLSLDNVTYHQLGIEGRPSEHILRKPKVHYYVKINTIGANFTSKKNHCEKIQKCFQNCPISFDFVISWIPIDAGNCPSSIAKYFHDLGYKVFEKEPHVKQNLSSNLRIPSFKNLQEEHSLLQALEWIGTQAVDIPSNENEFEFLEFSKEESRLNVTTIEGLFSPQQIYQLTERLNAYLRSRDELSVPWVSVTVFGPRDCCLSWGSRENSYRTNGDNFYSLILDRNCSSLCTVREATRPMRFYHKASNKN